MPDQVTAKAVAATLRLVATDVNGCTSTATDVTDLSTSRTATRMNSGTMMVPGNPTTIRVCRYQAGWLEQSAHLASAQIQSLVKILNLLPSGFTHVDPKAIPSPSYCRHPASSLGALTGPAIADSQIYLVNVGYNDSGSPLVIRARFSLCGDVGATNGSRSGQRTAQLVKALSSFAGDAQGSP